MKHQPRVDPLVTELLGAISSAEEEEIKESMASALAAVIASGGVNISDGVMASVISFAEECLQIPKHLEPFANAVARMVAAMAKSKAAGVRSLEM